MRIIVDGMPRTMGGIGTIILNIAEYSRSVVVNDGIEFEFIIAGRSGYIPLLEKIGYKYYVAPAIHNIKEYKRFLEHLFASNHFDYLWFNNTSKVNIWLPEYAKKKGVRIITHPHGVDIEEKGVKRLIFKLLNTIHTKKMYSLIDIPLSCSEEAADIYYKGSPSLRKQTMIIRNSISTSKFSFSNSAREHIRESLGINSNDYLLGAVGRLTKVKNYPFLVDMLTSLDDHYKLIILGDGEDREDLEAYIDKKGVRDRCWLVGMKTNTPDYLSAMDYFMLPSLNEGMPYSVIEAQAEGLPCIVSDTLTKELKITDLVTYITIRDSKEWVKKIKDTPTCKCRHEYSRRVLECGYSIDKTYEEFISLLNGTRL